jgi:hypothetical protein
MMDAFVKAFVYFIVLIDYCHFYFDLTVKYRYIRILIGRESPPSYNLMRKGMAYFGVGFGGVY